MLRGRSVGRLLLLVNVCTYTCLMLLVLQSPSHYPLTSTQYRDFDYREFFEDAPKFGVKYGTAKLPFIVQPLIKEIISYTTKTVKSSATVMEYRSDHNVELIIMPIDKRITQLQYIWHPPPPLAVWEDMHLMNDQSDLRSVKVWEANIESVNEFFSYVKTPQTSCRKLVKMGGQPLCDEDQQMFLDGHKLVCLDFPLMKSGSDPTNCLVLSFGVFLDWSFDEAIARYHCELHMFDIKKFPENVTTKYPWAHYHEEGLSASHVPHINYYPNYNAKSMMLDYTNLLKKYNLTSRAVNILKIDIEGDEWEVLRSLRANPHLNAVGQIHLEIHSHDILDKKSAKEQISMMQHQYDILRDIESLGFARVGYWDNVMDRYAFYDENDQRYDTAGELIYINTNWFKESLTNGLKNFVINIRS